MFKQKYRQIGAKITYFRKLKGYTQEELSFRASISASYLSKIERGAYVTGIPLSTLMRIALALEVDIDKFFKDAE